jgi:uncharacterized membrane protein
MPWLNTKPPEAVEKGISGLCYLSFGLIGLLYIILSGKSSQSPFFRFHFLQAILLGILGVLLNWTAFAFAQILLGIFGMFGDAGATPSQFLAVGLGYLNRGVSCIGILLLVYGCIMALLGKYAELPIISKLVRQQMR